jgi:uncharacterized protein (TIGR03790 family)
MCLVAGLTGALFGAEPAPPAPPGGAGSEVVLVYNTNVEASWSVAAHYAARRGVPTNQMIGLELPAGEEMSRATYVDGLETPLLRELESRGLFQIEPAATATAAAPGVTPGRRLSGSTIRYAILCYGIPIKILKDDSLAEKEAANLQPELRRNEASVDSQLACLPMASMRPLTWAGFLPNPAYGTTNASWMHPTNGLLMVSRLDGPTPEIAMGLVDKAMEAERVGLWGRAYIDSRGLTNGGYLIGDTWMREAARLCRQFGFETDLDEREATWTRGHPFDDVAIYAGWYDWSASGPFLEPKVAFQPGAFAYHLHSFSAATLRSKDENWVGPLLDRGAAATIGNVYEPYLSGTADLAVFFSRWLRLRFSYGEAAWASLGTLSWQNLVIGDPLYRPFIRGEQQLHQQLEADKSGLLAWSHLLVVNRNLAMNSPVDELIGYLEKLPMTRSSALLTEKLSRLYYLKGKYSFAIMTAEDALKRGPDPVEKLRLYLWLAHLRSYYGPDAKALGYYQAVLKEYPNYPDPDRLEIYRKMLPLARNEMDKDLVATCEKEIQRLGTP